MNNSKLKRKFYRAWYKQDYDLVCEMCNKFSWLNFYIPKSNQPYFKSLFATDNK